MTATGTCHPLLAPPEQLSRSIQDLSYPRFAQKPNYFCLQVVFSLGVVLFPPVVLLLKLADSNPWASRAGGKFGTCTKWRVVTCPSPQVSQSPNEQLEAKHVYYTLESPLYHKGSAVLEENHVRFQTNKVVWWYAIIIIIISRIHFLSKSREILRQEALQHAILQFLVQRCNLLDRNKQQICAGSVS